LAEQGNPKAIRPNPHVGAVVVSANDEIVGEGFHQKAGEAHAEVMAIRNALDHGAKLDTCTLYVTLEPCSHTGKTPPCTTLILQHRIPRVVIGSMDPNPLVSGAEILRKNGVVVEVHVLPEILALNDTFIINQSLKRPKLRPQISDHPEWKDCRPFRQQADGFQIRKAVSMFMNT